ncbi:NADH-quinone oxidoreductase subunit M [Nocardioides sp. KIGAM211]|uniref:NADH-quinone oxidoreductase subunit M n=1 Tax=Nocardioides luti TaxID=2761101 RepID=A0A7X0RFG9_9ACTN|nr:NADH-quinone oxidoreductase subunit M [Nocardioides luti]MBB6627346.1 NADH-quinone oxidoreductase subunit M [Nocardioides luti]
MTQFPWLTVLVAVPLVGALVVAFLPKSPGSALPKLVGLGASVLTLAVGIAIALQYDTGGGMQLTEDVEWIHALGVHYALGVDGLGLLLILLTVVLVPLVLIGSWHDANDSNPAAFFAWALALEGLSLAVFAATDVFLFYVVFEATLIPAYFLIGGFGREGRAFAALKFLMYQLGGGLVLLGSVIGLYVVSAQQGSPSYLLSDLANLDMSTSAERWLFAGFFIAFAVKAPLFPLHTWLADTTEKATPGTSVLLVCVLDKIGTFGMLRFCLGLFPEASQWATPVVIVLALVSIVYGALIAIGQDDLLRLIGLTSLSHFGFITLGIFAFSSQGASGSILYMVNHGIGTAALFLLAGYLIRRRGTSLISQMRGVEKSAPVLAGLFLVAGLATLGLPGLSQFVSEILVLISAFDHAWWAGAVAVSGIVLAAVYVLWAYQRVFTGPDVVEGGAAPAPVAAATPDLDRREVGSVAPLVLALVLFGFFPMPLLDVSNPTVSDLMQHVGVSDDPPVVPAAGSDSHEEGQQ